MSNNLKHLTTAKPITEYDLRLLRIFQAVVEHGGFSAAEKALGVTRSTISNHMANLESRMGLTLCLRGRGGFTLTEDGQAVYQGLSVLLESLNDFSLLINSLNKELSGELVILCADQLDKVKQKRLAHVIELVSQQAPNLHIVLENDTIVNIEKQLMQNKAHIGIFPGYQKVEGLIYQSLTEEPMYLCCGQKHALYSKNKDISNKELAQVPTIHPGINIDEEGRKKLEQLNLSAKSYQFDTRKAMILSGQYLGYMPFNYIEDELKTKEIKILQAETLSYQFKLSLVCNKVPREPKKIELLQKAFATAFSTDP